MPAAKARNEGFKVNVKHRTAQSRLRGLAMLRPIPASNNNSAEIVPAPPPKNEGFIFVGQRVLPRRWLTQRLFKPLVSPQHEPHDNERKRQRAAATRPVDEQEVRYLEN